MKNIWIVGVGEPLPVDGKNERLHRCGKQAQFLSKFYNVKWITSDFNHSKKNLVMVKIKFFFLININYIY